VLVAGRILLCWIFPLSLLPTKCSFVVYCHSSGSPLSLPLAANFDALFLGDLRTPCVFLLIGSDILICGPFIPPQGPLVVASSLPIEYLQRVWSLETVRIAENSLLRGFVSISTCIEPLPRLFGVLFCGAVVCLLVSA